MTQEQKNLLMRDLCARLPYGVKIAMPGLWDNEITIEPLNEIFKGDDDLFRVNGNGHCIEYIKPYLFPLSSMTEEQYDELEKTTLNDYMNHMRITNELREKVEFITHWPLYSPDIIDWFNRNHFDYRGLIEMGLALKAPDGMYN
jgi:hypothetical protein